MKKRKTSRKIELCLLDHISELRNGYEIVAYYSKKTNRYHATIDPAAGFKGKCQVFSWHRNSSPVEDVTLSPYQQIAHKGFGSADAARLGLVEVRGEELRSVRSEFDERCFIDGTWGYPNDRSMMLNCYKSEHAERQQMDVDCFDGFCCECARRLKDRIGELPDALPKTGNCPWKTGRSARCDASCVKKCQMLWAMRHPETAGEYHEPLHPMDLEGFHWAFDDRDRLPKKALRTQGRKTRFVHSISLRDQFYRICLRERKSGNYYINIVSHGEWLPTVVISHDLKKCLQASRSMPLCIGCNPEKFADLCVAPEDIAEEYSAVSAMERLCFTDGKRYFPDEVDAHLRQILRFRDYCRDCKRVAKGGCRMCAGRSNAVRRQDPETVCREDCLFLWLLRHRREIEGWRKYKPIRVWDEAYRKAYETELKKRNLVEGEQ